jgi:hypothetical protein
MRTILNKVAAGLLLGFLAISPLAAQNGTPMEADTNSTPRYSEEFAKQKLELEKEMTKDRLDTEKDIASSKYQSQRLMVHDIAWNSWVVLVILVFFFGYLKDKRRHETIRLMVEKGTPLTPELLDGLRKKPRRGARAYDSQGYLCWGITETLVAVALMIVFHSGGGRTAAWIVLAVGVANLLLWCIDKLFGNSGQNK